MKLSDVLHKYINEGRNGRSDKSTAKDISLTDEQLMELWKKAMDLESDLICLRAGLKRLGDTRFRSERK